MLKEYMPWSLQGLYALSIQHKDLSIILPLSLVHRLVGGLDHPGPGAELKELDPPKGLGEQVCKLVLGVDVACLDAPVLQAASDEVVSHPDVLAPYLRQGRKINVAPGTNGSFKVEEPVAVQQTQ